MFSSSEASRSRAVKRAMKEGVDETTAHQLAWATFPFDDRVPLAHREVERAIRRDSREFVGDVKQLAPIEARARAIGLLRLWTAIVDDFSYRSRYTQVADGTYRSLVDGAVVTRGKRPALDT